MIPTTSFGKPLKTALARAYGTYILAIKASVKEMTEARNLGWVEIDVLDGIEALASMDSKTKIAGMSQRLRELLADPNLADSETLRNEFRCVYHEAESIAFPASATFVAHAQALTNWTRNYNLIIADVARLRELDIAARSDPTFKSYVSELSAIMPKVAEAPDIAKYSQFFNIYSEALVLRFLRSKLPTEKIRETASETPDFQCELPDGRIFYVEVKTLDIVGGNMRHDEMMVDAIEQAVTLKEQIDAGKAIAVSEGEFAPYKRYSEAETYDPRSLVRAIDTLREKSFQAFKAGQFAMGPTIALAVVDRLIIPGGQRAIVPYYIDHMPSPCCVSGVLWHAAFGVPGTLIFRAPEFEGKPSFEAHLSRHGIFVDPGRSFPGIALIALSLRDNTALGLYQVQQKAPSTWSTDNTIEALSSICASYNDDQNTCAWQLLDSL